MRDEPEPLVKVFIYAGLVISVILVIGCLVTFGQAVFEIFTPQSAQQSSLASGAAASSTLLCKNTGAYAGQRVTCTIQRAYCDYSENTYGGQTFCNDAPYPNNHFTMLVWDRDWTHYNSRCIVVTGAVSIYDGKPQIIVTSTSQVDYCP